MTVGEAVQRWAATSILETAGGISGSSGGDDDEEDKSDTFATGLGAAGVEAGTACFLITASL